MVKKIRSRAFPQRWIMKQFACRYFSTDPPRRFPDQMALLFQGYKVTYRQLQEMVDRMAKALQSMGIGQGDSVAILLPNVIPCVVAYYAILKIGAQVVMNNPLYSDRELEHQFNDSDAKLLITLDLLAKRMVDLRPRKTVSKPSFTLPSAITCPFPKIFCFLWWGRKKDLRPMSHRHPIC